MGFRQGSAPKYLMEGVPSNIWAVYSPKIFHGWGSVKYLAPKYFTEGVPSNIWGVYSPKMFHGRGSVKYLGGVQPQNI